MPAKAFVLIETEVGSTPQVANTLRTINWIDSADIVTGNFDIIALVEAPDMEAMAEIVTGKIQGLNGVLRTITCVATG